MWATVAPKGLSLSCFNVFFIDKQISLMASNWARAYSGFALGCLAWHHEYLYGEPAPASGGTCIHLCVFTHQAWALADQEALANPSLQSAANSRESSGIIMCAKARSQHISPSSLPMGKPQPEHHGCKHNLETEEKYTGTPPPFFTWPRRIVRRWACFTLSNRSSPFSK